MESVSRSCTSEPGRPQWPEAAVADLPYPVWKNNSCALDCCLWMMKNLRIFDQYTDVNAISNINEKAIDDINFAAITKFDGKAMTAFQRRTIEIMRVCWSLAGAGAVNSFRDELQEIWYRALCIKAKRCNDFISARDVWEIMTAPAESTRIRFVQQQVCYCRGRNFRAEKSRLNLVLGGAIAARLADNNGATLKTASLEQVLNAYFSSEDLGPKGCGSGKCRAEGKMHTFVRDATPPLLTIFGVERPMALTGAPLRFRYYAITASHFQKRSATYVVRAVVLSKGAHFTVMWYNWKGETLDGGWHYDGMAPAMEPREPGLEALATGVLLDTMARRIKSFENIAFMVLEKLDDTVEREKPR